MIRGSKIIITRKNDPGDRIGQSLREMGVNVFNLELLQFNPIKLNINDLEQIVSGAYKWLVFTSSNGVASFFDQLNDHFPEYRLESKIAVFGQRTAQTLHCYGYQADIVGQNETAVTLASALERDVTSNDQVLLLLGNLAANELTVALSVFCRTRRINIYETLGFKSTDQEILNMITEDNYDLIIITSPSSYKSLKFNMQFAFNPNSAKVVCLGPTTEAALAEDGILPIISAKPSDNPSLYELIEDRLHEVSNNKSI